MNNIVVKKIFWYKYPEHKPAHNIVRCLVCNGRHTTNILWWFGKWKPFWLGLHVEYWAYLPKGVNNERI